MGQPPLPRPVVIPTTQEMQPVQMWMFISSARRKRTVQPAFWHWSRASLTITSVLLIFRPKEMPSTFFAIVILL